ncbi:hypothetical protein LOTGIDRAFT_160733 [Lottia gigantea]|uniref:Uncharacterized protein n=1 Tax=Lottia gigantea TaxID=225164 RepID=V4AMZ5_LOTGI|nr:hypothetical protein LOTGIDRAFT_160733 [Lottia gigantea]ESO94981.1 hypothetical protein LOTGIDRAFT_160733 [Lottia gigantea]
MDIEEANKFINSLVKNLQVLCHGHVNFNNSIQVIGHLYLNVDSQTNIDYIVNEKVCKNDNSSTMFVSNSYHSEPKAKVNKIPETQQAPDKSNDLTSGHFNMANQRSTSHPQHNLNQTNDTFGPNRKKRIRPEKQYIIHPPKIFKPTVTEVSPLRQPSVRSPQSDFVDNDRNLFHKSNQPSTSATNSSYNTESVSQSRIHNSEPDEEENKPFQVIPSIDLEIDLSRVKAEPVDRGEDDGSTNFTSGVGTSEASTPNNDNNCDNSVLADDMCSDDYLIGLRDKTLGLYPTSLQQSSDLASSSSFNLSSSSTAVGSSSFYNSKNSPVTMMSAEQIEKIMGNSKKKTVISVKMKQDICRIKDNCPQITQSGIIKIVQKKYGIVIGQSTVATILQSKDRWMSLFDDSY